VDELGEARLSRPRLPTDQDGAAGACEPRGGAQREDHDRALRDQVRRVAAGDLLAQILILALEATDMLEAIDHELDRFGSPGLQEDVARAAAERLHLGIGRVLAGDRDRRHLGVAGAQGAEELRALAGLAVALDVDEHEVGDGRARALERLGGRARLDDLVAELGYRLGEAGPAGEVRVDYQNSFRRHRRARGMESGGPWRRWGAAQGISREGAGLFRVFRRL
jgi:hypothetical protein